MVRRGSGLDSIAALEGRRAAINGRDSLSGYFQLNAVGVRPSEIVETGAHRGSLAAVARGLVDFAAIDAQCWRLAQIHHPETVAALEVIGWSAPAPAPPFITGACHGEDDAAQLAEALAEAIASEDGAPAAAEIGLVGVERLSFDDYAQALRPLLTDVALAPPQSS